MKNIYCLLLAILFFSSRSDSQNESESSQTWQKYVHIEISGLLPNTTLKENIPIRQNVSSNSYYNHNVAKIVAQTNGLTYAAKLELYNNQLNFGFSLGVKYWLYFTTIKGRMSENAEYFYFRYASNQQESKYARLKNITENQHYLTVPVDVRYYFLNRKRLGLFVRMSADVGFNVHHKLDVTFFNPEMNLNKTEVLSIIQQTLDKVYYSASASLGFRYYYIEKISLNVEFNILSKYLGGNYFILTDAERYSAIKASVQIPFHLILK